MEGLNLTQYKLDTFKGAKNIYTVIGSFGEGAAKLGIHIQIVSFPQPVGEPVDGKQKVVAVVGLKVRLAMIGQAGVAVNVSPFRLRTRQKFTLPNDQPIGGLLLYPAMVVLGHASISPKDVVEIVKTEEVGEKLEHILLKAMEEGEWVPQASVAALVDTAVSQVPTDFNIPVELPKLKSKDGLVYTFGPVYTKGEDEDEDE